MSGRKNNLYQFQVLASVTMSSSVISSVTNIQYLDNVGVQFNFTGNSIGSFSVQVSADYSQDNNSNVLNPGTWISLTLSPSPSANGSAGSIYVDLNQLSAPWIRSQYVGNSGSGVLSTYITGKMI